MDESSHTQPPATPPYRPKTHSPQTHQKKHEGFINVLSTIGVLLIAPAIALALTAYIFQPYQVDGPSMESTLHNGDRLIVWKAARTWSRLTGHQYVPNRGDVIIFVGSNLGLIGDSQQDPTKQLVKRVIALPGERVVVKNNILTVYNTTHPQGFQPDKTLPYGNVINGTNNDGQWVVGKNQLFVCGDNRYDSLDSRLFGPINTKDIVGKLVMRVLPVNQAERF